MNFSSLPHKNLFISLAIALMIVGVGVYVNHIPGMGREQSLKTQDVALSTSTLDTIDFTDRDSDSDGLPDWEERLYGSDPFKTDSDGDGTLDGVEVRIERNPALPNTAKKGEQPNDSLSIVRDPHFATSSTDILGIQKEFFAKFLATQSKEIRATTYRDLLKGFDAKKYLPKTDVVGLNVSSDNSIDGMRTYGNAFGILIRKYTVRAHRTEEEILSDALTNKDSAALKELQLPAVTYRNFANDLRALQVPSSLAKQHLLIINGYAGMSQGLLDMQSLFEDPIVGAGGYEGYTIKRLDVTNGYAQVVQAFAEKGVTFTKDEPGAPFYWNTVRGNTTKP